MEGLVHLQKAPSKKAVQELFIFTFRVRESPISEKDLERISESFKLSKEETEEVFFQLIPNSNFSFKIE